MQKEVHINYNLEKVAKNYSNMSIKLNEMKNDVKKYRNELDWKVSQKEEINNKLDDVIKIIEKFDMLNVKISEFINLTLSDFKRVDDMMTKKLNTSITISISENGAENSPKPNPAFNSSKGYGGDQGSPMSNYDEVAGIVKKHNPNFTKKQIEDYLEKLNSEGCGYVALTNTLFSQYVGKEKEFEKKFGFPMYNEKGELNHNALITDFYCATDNHNKEGWWIFSHDSVNNKEDISATEGSGTNEDKRKYRWEMYLDDHDVDVEVDNDVRVTPDNFNKVAKDGDLVVRINPCILQDEKGNVVTNINGGHAMTATGVTDDGRYIVSSWGQKYYVDPKESYNYLDFQQVKY